VFRKFQALKHNKLPKKKWIERGKTKTKHQQRPETCASPGPTPLVPHPHLDAPATTQLQTTGLSKLLPRPHACAHDQKRGG
jgi:hypothetical protein